jgi:hypothetical protein
MAFVEQNGPLHPELGSCWMWEGFEHKGYGRFHIEGRTFRAHRWAYTNFVGKIPTNKVIDHLCRNTLCVRPSHLEAVSQRENVLRGEGPASVYARRSHCSKGHLYSEDTPVVGNTRRCRQCANDWSKGTNSKGVTDGRTHGKASTYGVGCRCVPCKEAKRVQDAKRRVK